jgi:hypothetical protein
MNRIILHIGMHKTGSTSIQRALAGFDDGLTKYPDLGYANHSIPFYTVFSGRHHDYKIWKLQGLSPEEIEKKRAQCFNSIEASLGWCSNRNIIFSGEGLSIISEKGIDAIKNLLDRYSDNISIVGYVRDPCSYVKSAWQQRIKTGNNMLPPDGPMYRFRFEKFVSLFGAENTILRHYQKQQLIGEDAVTDFCNLAGIKPAVATTYENASLSTEAIKCIYILNNYIDPFDGDRTSNLARDIFIRTVSNLFPGEFDVPVELYRHVISEEDCDWLESFSGIKLLRAEASDISNSSSKDKGLFFEDLSEGTVEALLKCISSNVDLGRDPLKLVRRLYYECYLNTPPSKIDFCADRYLELNPDLKLTGVNPYEHYLLHGVKEGRRIK